PVVVVRSNVECLVVDRDALRGRADNGNAAARWGKRDLTSYQCGHLATSINEKSRSRRVGDGEKRRGAMRALRGPGIDWPRGACARRGQGNMRHISIRASQRGIR